MFRRRPPRRPPPPRGRPGAVPPAVREAERLFQQGRYQEAAHRFAQLAERADQRGLEEAAGRLYLRSGRALLEAGQVEPALDQTRRALKAMVRAGRPGQARRMFQQMIAILEQRGYHTQAETLRQEAAEYAAGLMERGPLRPGRGTGPHLELPANCPNCGAALKPESYRQARPGAVECAYCGTIVQARTAE